MIKLSYDMLRNIAGAPVNKTVVENIVKEMPALMEKYGINTRLRVAHFLAQLAHESDHFRTFEEYASGAAYEGRRDLGNVYRGDGKRFKGRGPIQITGRYNYRKYGQAMGVDLEVNPELLETPLYGCWAAALYWHKNSLNDWADKDNGKQITRKINGGYTHLKERLEMVRRAKSVIKDSMFTKVLASMDDSLDVPVSNTSVKTTEEIPGEK